MQFQFPQWPYFDETERRALSDTLESGLWWSGYEGSPAIDFEKRFAEHHGAKAGITTTNGTHALELALRVLNIKAGDEVIVPSMTFIATSTAVHAVGARPVAVDVRRDTWCLDPDRFAEAISPRTRAVMPVHFGGKICEMSRIRAVAEEHGIAVVEDAAHAHGAFDGGHMAGSFGVMAAFSFQNFKLITAGEGGILLLNDPKLVETAERLVNCGRLRSEHGYSHRLPGSNYRMTAFQAALLNCQLDRIELFGKRRSENSAALDEAFNRMPGITPQSDVSNGRHSRYMYLFTYDDGSDTPAKGRDALVKELTNLGVPARPIYPRVQDMPFERSENPPCPVSREIAETGIWLHHRVLIGDRPTALQAADALCQALNLPAQT